MSWPRIETVQVCVGAAWGVTRGQMLVADRRRVIAEPRQVAMALAWWLGPRSFAQVGSAFGGRHHSTVLHAVHRVADRLAKGEPGLLRRVVEALKLLKAVDDARAEREAARVAA